MLVPDQTVVDLKTRKELADRLQGHGMHPQQLPRSHVHPLINEQMLNCKGILDGFLFVVAHVVLRLRPKASCLYERVESIRFKKRKTEKGDEDSSSGYDKKFRGGGKYTEARRDQASHNGYAAIRNKSLRKAHADMWEIRSQLRGVFKPS